MSSYIKKAACNGRRPSHLGKLSCVQRPNLVARLLRNRRIPRFVFAPPGYGKSFLAIDYCETVFKFSHVFWVRATSPCFIRDLDSGLIAHSISAADSEAALVVFDDVPRLEPDRIEKLQSQIGLLLDRGCEVVVMGTPSAAACCEPFENKIVLGAIDLLLSEQELAASPAALPSPSLSAAAVDMQRMQAQPAGAAAAVALRIPALAWSNAPEQLEAFLSGLFEEDLAMQQEAAILRMMVVGSGSMAEAFAEADEAGVAVARLAHDYPHLGIDEAGERFDCSVFPVEGVIAAAKMATRRVTAEFYGTRRDNLALHLADLAYAEGAHERGCDIARLLMTARSRGAWAAAHAYGLVRSSAFLPAQRLISSIEKPAADVRDRLTILELACRMHLQDGAVAVLCARRLAFARTAAPGMRLICLVALARRGPLGLAERSLSEIQDILDNATDSQLSCPPSAVLLARGALELSKGVDCLARFLEYECAEFTERDADALCILSAWLFDALANGSAFAKDPAEALRGDALAKALTVVVPASVASFVRGRLEDAVGVAIDAFAVAAGLAMEHARMRGIAIVDSPLSAATLLALRRAEASVLGQRMRFELDGAHDQALQIDRVETHPDIIYPVAPQEVKPPAAKRAPVLTIRFFGRLGLSIGDTPVDDRLIGRRKVRKLIVMLAANCGRELGRDAICGQLWPASSLDVARRNFYNVISLLKRAITLPDGTCPYLIRRRMSCALDDRTVMTDIMRLDQICREFLFGEPDEAAWTDLLAEIDRDFFSEVLPEESEDDYIASLRGSIGVRLTDALAMGSRRITESGGPECGIWLARAALNRDRTREDAYIALMNAQDAAHQRPAALLTFQIMRNALKEDLGVDPSRKAREVYERILMEDGRMVTAAC